MSSVRERLENCLTEPEFIPPGITGLAQPKDVAVMWCFKQKVRDLYVKHHIDHAFCSNPTERRNLSINVVVQAWDSIGSDLIRRGFVKADLIPTGPRAQDGSFVVVEPNGTEDGGELNTTA